MKIIFNSSPLIFLARLGFLDSFVNSAEEFYLPASVAEEIYAKSDEACQSVRALIDSGKITNRAIKLTFLANSLNARLGLGESEAMVVLQKRFESRRSDSITASYAAIPKI